MKKPLALILLRCFCTPSTELKSECRVNSSMNETIGCEVAAVTPGPGQVGPLPSASPVHSPQALIKLKKQRV